MDQDNVIESLRNLANKWRSFAAGDGSALYRAGFEHCAGELDQTLDTLERPSEDEKGLEPRLLKPPQG